MNLRTWLVVLALLSIFTGLPINGQWFFTYQNTFSGIDVYVLNPTARFEWASFLSWVITFLSGSSILLFPFFYKRIKFFKIVLLIIPTAFLIFQTRLFIPMLVVFVPFFITWQITLILAKRELNNTKTSS